MAKLTTPHLKDVVPTPLALKGLGDRLTEVSVNGAPLTAVRITVDAEQGGVGAVLLLSVGDDNGQPVWTDLSVAVAKGATPEVSARVNRMLKGFAFQRVGLSTATPIVPIIGMNWRSRQVSATYRRRSYALPVHVEANPNLLGSTHIYTRWSVRTTPTVMETNTAAGFAPLSKTSAPKRRTARGRSQSSPTISQQVGATVAPIQTPVTPKVTKPQTSIPVAPFRVTKLPAGHPGIMAELAAQPYTVHVDPSVQARLDRAYAQFSRGKKTVVALRGPSGAGKTLSAMNLAAVKGLPFKKFEVQGMRDFADWYGSVGLTESNGASVTSFVPSDLAQCIDIDGPYGGIPRLILLDEVTRAETAAALNAILALTDGHGSVYIPDARKSITVDPTVLFVLTANIGTGFNGTLPLDRAVSNRVNKWVLIDYPEPTIEAAIIAEQAAIPQGVSTKLVQVAVQLRAMAHRGELPVGPSTRQLVAVGDAIKDGASPVQAFEEGFVWEAEMSVEGGAESDYAKAMFSVNQVLR